MKYDDSIFTPDQIDAAYVNSLVDLINACRIMGIEIDKVSHFQNGWAVTFKGYDNADAICHDGSCNSPCYTPAYFKPNHNNDWSRTGKWETMGFPWDNEGISVHSAQELALYLAALKNGSNVWENEGH